MEPVKKIVLVSPDKDDLQSGPDSAWMEKLGANLGLVLKKYTGETLQSLSPGSKQAGEAFDKPVFLMVVMHVSYSSSAKYMNFLKKAAADHGDRIVKLMRIDTSTAIAEKTPELYANAASVELFTSEEGSDQELWTDEDSDIYWSRLLDLAAEVKALSAPTVRKAVEGTGRMIYLAQAAIDMSRNRDIMRRELLEHGFQVVPDTDLRIQQANLKSHIQNLADKSRMVIHLLGDAYDETMKETGKSLAEIQVQYITEYLEAIENNPVHAEKDLNRLIWIDPDFTPADSKQEEFISQLKRDIESLHRTEIIQNPIELFKTLVIKRLRQRDPGVSTKQQREAAGGRFIYIIHAMDDQVEASELAEGLSKGGIITGMLDYTKEQRGLLNDHKNYLQACYGAIVYYGQKNRAWLQSKVMDLLKAPGLGRSHSLETRQILTGKKDMLEDYVLPAEISITRDPDLPKAVNQLLKNLK